MPGVQHHLRVIVAWREPTAQALWRTLAVHCPWLDVTYVQVSAIDQYLNVRDYYHILYISPYDWNCFTPTAQRKFANRVRLLILGPGPAVSAELTDIHAGVYFPHAIPEAEAKDCLVKWHTCIAEDSTALHCAEKSDGRLVFVGDETCLDMPEVAVPSGSSVPPSPSLLPDEGRTSTQLGRNSSLSGRETESGVTIGQINVARDMIVGTNVVYKVTETQPEDMLRGRRRMPSSEETATGISPGLYKRLRTTLLRCGPFGSDDNLWAVFTDARIVAWRNTLPGASSRASRVDALIAFLYDKYSDSQQNALVLLLHVLSDPIDSGDACHRQLAELASELESLLEKPSAV
jgi:hypothetical protein